MEEGRAERPGGKMVRKGRQKPRKETEEDRTTGRTGEGHHHPEYQHEMHHYTEVRAVGARRWDLKRSIAARRGVRLLLSDHKP